MCKDNLTLKDYSIEFVSNSASATVQLIPFVGGALNQMIFGYLSSLQMKRIENYLVKVSEYLQSGEMQKEVLDQIDELNYFHQQLITNGLVIDNSPTSIGINILEQPKITKMGELFLDYILENKK